MHFSFCRKTRFAGLCLSLALAFPTVTSAQDYVAESAELIPCGVMYQTRPGDSLHSIAKRAYGWGKYPAVYLANRDVLPDLTVLPVGVRLLVPCLDGTGPTNRREALALEAEAALAQSGPTFIEAPQLAKAPAAETPPARPQPAEAPPEEAPLAMVTALAEPDLAAPAATLPPADPERILLLTGSGLTRLTGGEFGGGGLITKLVTRSIALQAPDQPFAVTFVNDWRAHLGGLLLSGALDVGFPWLKPDCDAPDRLDGEARLLCDEFDFSNPIYEVAFAFYVREDDAMPDGVTAASLAGKRICRPERRYSFAIDLPDPPPGVQMMNAETAADCFDMLLGNDADVVLVVRQEAEQEIRKSAIAEQTREIESLAIARTLHAIAPRANPDGAAYLRLIDAGMERLMASGEWFQIVSTHHASQLALAQ